MTTSSLRRHRGGGGGPLDLSIKQDPDASYLSGQNYHAMEEDQNEEDMRSSASNYGGSTTIRPEDHAGRNGRSDARK